MATEIKYKSQTIAIEAGETATLHTTDKKLTGDIEVTAPAESGGGAKKYNISYTGIADIGEGSYEFFPTEIYENQTICILTDAPWFGGCSAKGAEYNYTHLSLSNRGNLTIVKLFNPTSDVTVSFIAN